MGAPMKTILSFGEILWDLLPSGPVLGGAPFNLAYRLHAFGERALVASRLGADELGRGARRRLEEEGMDASLVQNDPARPTGTARVRVDAQGRPDFEIAPGAAFDAIEVSERLLAEAGRADALAFGTLAQRDPVSRAALGRVLDAHRGLAFLDLNLREGAATRETVTASLERADVLKLNEDEAQRIGRWWGIPGHSLTGLGHGILERWSLSRLVITLADRGVLGLSAEEALYVPGYEIPVVDACGAGDAFSAAFLRTLLQGRSFLEGLRLGNALGACVAGQAGGTQPVPLEEVRRLLAPGAPRRVEPGLTSLLIDGA
jgi:fructokinase